MLTILPLAINYPQPPTAGSSHLPMPQKGPTLYMGEATPEGKGAPALKAPSNTPASPALEVPDARPRSAAADQQWSPAVGGAAETGSVSMRLRMASGAAGGSPAAAAAQQQPGSSRQDSHGSPISFGSHCTPAAAGPAAFGSPQDTPSPSRTLDFAGASPLKSLASPAALAGAAAAGRLPDVSAFADASGVAAAAAGGPAAAAGRDGGGTPVPLEELLASFQDSATKENAAEIFGPVGRAAGAGTQDADGGGGGGGRAAPGAAAKRGGGAWRTALLLLVVALLAGAGAAGYHAATNLPGGPAIPSNCSIDNAQQCADAYAAYFKGEHGADLPPLQLALLKAKWVVQDWVRYAQHGKLPWDAMLEMAAAGAPPELAPVPAELLAAAERLVQQRDAEERRPAAVQEPVAAPVTPSAPEELPAEEEPAAVEQAEEPVVAIEEPKASVVEEPAAVEELVAEEKPAIEQQPAAAVEPEQQQEEAVEASAEEELAAESEDAAVAAPKRSWGRAILAAIRFLFVTLFVLLLLAAAAFGAVHVLHGTGAQWLGASGGEDAQLAAPTPARRVRKSAAAAAAALAVGARVLTPRFKVGGLAALLPCLQPRPNHFTAFATPHDLPPAPSPLRHRPTHTGPQTPRCPGHRRNGGGGARRRPPGGRHPGRRPAARRQR
jgi:hypothetical protein